MRIKLGFVLCVLMKLHAPFRVTWYLLVLRYAKNLEAFIHGPKMCRGLLLLTITLIFPSPLFAQEISPGIKKSVVKNFQPDLSKFMPFGTTEDCRLKLKGDATCDGAINLFDLSLWEVEFNLSKSPKRADFNNDGIVNLLDFGIWRNTFYPQQSADSGSFLTFLSSIINLKSLIKNLYAQENQTSLNSSQAFISGSGNSLVLNTDLNGSSQQVSFDPLGNAQSSQLFDKNGQLTAGVSFLNSGTTIVSTRQDGVHVQINKTAGGVVIEYFRNPDGSLIAVKSWPTLASYQTGEPPLSVTIPGQGNTRNVLNIQPNGDGISEKTDNFGNVLSRNQIRRNGTLVSEDFQSKTIVQSNSQVGFTTLSMENNLGGDTSYMFFKGELYGITQTDGKDSYYISKPLDSEGNSWSFESNINGVKSEKTVSDPVKELKSNTPDPKELIKYINYYKSASPDPAAVDFSDGFTSNSRAIQYQIQKANEILTISQTQAPSILGIVKEAQAQAEITKQTKSDVKDGVLVQVSEFTGTNGQINMQVQIFGPGPTGGAAQIQTGNSIVTLNGTNVPDISGKTPGGAMTAVKAAAQAGNAQTAPNAQPLSSLPSVPTDPAQPPDTKSEPAPATCTGNCTTIGTALIDFEKQKAGGGIQDLSTWLGSANLTPEQRTEVQTLQNTHGSFSAAVRAELGADWGKYDAAVADGTPGGLKGAAIKAGLTSAVADRLEQDAINSTGLQTKNSDGSAPGISVTNIPANPPEGGAPPVSPPAAAAPTATGLPAREATMSLGNGYLSTITGYVDTDITKPGFEGFATKITKDGIEVATQISDLKNNNATYTDLRGTTTTHAGAVTGYEPAQNPYAPAGTNYATTVNLDGSVSIVAVGPGTAVDENGHVAAGRSVIGEELDFARNELARQSEETSNTTEVHNSIDYSTIGSGVTDDPATETPSGGIVDEAGNFGGEQNWSGNYNPSTPTEQTASDYGDSPDAGDPGGDNTGSVGGEF